MMRANSAIVAIDFETSATRGACACAIGMTRIVGQEIASSYYSLIRPPSARVCFSDIHGLTWRDLKNERTFGEVWPEIAGFIAGADFLVAHNARFDRDVLQACCAAYGKVPPGQPFLCTLRGARNGLRLKHYSLAAVSAYFGIELNHHHAGSDARACGLIHSRLTGLGITTAQMLLPPSSRLPKAG